jgi:hypothetical protein
MTRRELAASLAALGAAFNREVTEALAEAYWIGLSGLGADELACATQAALQGSKFMPTPAELREFAQPTRTVAQRSAVAWAAVRGAMRKHDYTVASIDFGPLVNTVLRAMGSWEWLCEQTRENLVFRERDFVRYFEAFASGPPAALRAEPLEGWGVGRVGCARVAVPIEGEAAPARMALPSPAGGKLGALVRELADGKSSGGHGGHGAQGDPATPFHVGHETAAAPDRSSSPLARATAAPITEAEKAEALVRIDAQLAEWRAHEGGAA